jgi:hypothetical protein
VKILLANPEPSTHGTDIVAKVFLAFYRATLIQDQARTRNNDFKGARAPIRSLQISISQSLLGDFCNKICYNRTSCTATNGPLIR